MRAQLSIDYIFFVQNLVRYRLCRRCTCLEITKLDLIESWAVLVYKKYGQNITSSALALRVKILHSIFVQAAENLG